MKTRILLVCSLLLAMAAAFFIYSHVNQARAEVKIFASPIQAGCYIAARSECRLHADPFTINIASGSRLVYFQLVAIDMDSSAQTMIYDFRTDQSNPAPPIGNTYTPSLVAQDFAASCGHRYEISLQGQDSFDSNPFNLGLTGVITCPSSAP